MIILDLLQRFEEYLRHERGRADSTCRCYLRDLRELATHTPGNVDQITLDQLRTYQRWLSKKGINATTINRKIAALTTFWQWLIIEGLATEVLTTRLPRQPTSMTIPCWLSKIELQRFVDIPVQRPGQEQPLNDRDFLAWKLLAWLGLRRSEVIGLKVCDVLLDEMQIIIRGIKTHRDRVMPLPETLKIDLQNFIANRDPGQHVFESASGGQWQPDSFNRAFQWHITECGLKGRGITPHSLRHTFATHMVGCNVHIVTVKELLGHADIKNTMLYVHTNVDHFRNELNRAWSSVGLSSEFEALA